MITGKTDEPPRTPGGKTNEAMVEPPRPPTHESTPLEELGPEVAEEIAERRPTEEPVTRREVEIPEPGDDERSRRTPRHAEPGESPVVGEQPREAA
jgi:hypothetical protein